MTWNPRTWNKAIVKRVLFAAVMLPPAIGFSNSPKHEKAKSSVKASAPKRLISTTR